MGLPVRCPKLRGPRAKDCMFKAVLMRFGTSRTTVFLVTLSRLNARPFTRSPGLFAFSGWQSRSIWGRRKSSSIYHDPTNFQVMLMNNPAKSWLKIQRPSYSGASLRSFRSVKTSSTAKLSGHPTGISWKVIRAKIFSMGLKGDSTKEMIGLPEVYCFFFLVKM